MKKLITYCLKLILIKSSVVVAANASAQPTAGADLSVQSKYIWRGMNFNDQAVFLPDAWLSWQGFTATLVGELEMTDVYQRHNQFTEVDYYLEYGRSFGPVGAALGYGHYVYPHTGTLSTGELYGKLKSSLKIVEVSVSAFYDAEEAGGLYLSPQISRSLPLKYVQPVLSLSAGYANKRHNRYYFLDSTTAGIDHSGFCDLTAGLGLSYGLPGPWGRYLTLSGNLNWSYILDEKLAAAFPDQRSNVWWGLSLAVSPLPSSEK